MIQHWLRRSRYRLVRVWATSALLALALTVAALAQAPSAPTNVLINAPASSTATVAGTVTLTPTFENVGIKATYTGDSDADNSMTVEFKATSSGTWLDAYAPFNDKRATVHGSNSNTANRYEFRGVIVGLTPGETYDVRVTYVDADGVTATAERTAEVTMLSDATVVRSGSTYYLDDVGSNGDGSVGSPFNTFANAFTGSACGDKLIVKPGTYAAFTFSKTCSASTWYVIEGENRDTVIISDGAAQNITISGDYVRLENLRLDDSGADAIEISTSRHDIWLENLYIEAVAADAPGSGVCASHYEDSGVKLVGSNYRVWIKNSTILAAAGLTGEDAAANCTLSPRYDSPVTGIGFGDMNATGQFVITGNTITGGFRDCIGNSPEGFSAQINHTDIGNNTVSGCKDDAIQVEGKDINLRQWGNTVESDASCFALETGFVGPVYVWRNYCTITFASGNTAVKGGGLQAAYFFHNTISTSVGVIDGLIGFGGYVTAYNNILQTRGNPVYSITETGTSFNYNIYNRIGGSAQIVSDWNGTPDYDTIAAFNSAEGQEANGLKADPLLDGSLHITSSSPAYNAGVSLANFNDANSTCPALNGAPEIGAYEVGGC
jgi:hypothetical protein